MKRKILGCLFALSVLSLAGGLCGCAAVPGVSTAAPAPSADTKSTGAQSLVLEVEYIPTAGYTWDIDSSGDGRMQITHQSVKEDASELSGAAREERYVLTAVKPGDLTLSLVCYQPWEGGDAPLYESLSLRIDENLQIEILEHITEGSAASDDVLPRISEPVIE